MAFGDFIKKAKEVAISSKLIDEDEIEEVSSASDFGARKLKEIFNDISNARELVKEAGYELSEIEVEMSIPPAITPHFLFLETISITRQKELLERTKGSKMLSLLLKSLFTASKLQSNVKMDDFRMDEVEVQIGIPPSIKLKFSKEVTENSDLLIYE